MKNELRQGYFSRILSIFQEYLFPITPFIDFFRGKGAISGGLHPGEFSRHQTKYRIQRIYNGWSNLFFSSLQKFKRSRLKTNLEKLKEKRDVNTL